MLPGGAGSLDELFEAVTWRQIGLHTKPIFLLNTDGYWTPLLSMIRQIIAEGFAEPELGDYVVTVPDVPSLQAGLRAAFG